jgi:CubicO group peptidase (beta-lactamase class C family)
MKKLLLLFITILLISCGKNKTAHDNVVAIHRKDSLTTALYNFYKQGHFNGLGVAISGADGNLYSKGFGFADLADKMPYTEQTLQTIGSVSKTFIGLALLKAQEMGKLNLDDGVNKYLPFILKNPNAGQAVITIRHLATHTSGINDTKAYSKFNYILYGNDRGAYAGDEIMNLQDAFVPMEELLKEALTEDGKYYSPDAWSVNKPGSRYVYTNFGAAIAALILERATGIPYDAFVEQYIFHPIKMDNTHFNNKPEVAERMSVLYADSVTAIKPYWLITYPDGGVASTADDMGKYIIELIKGYNGRGTLLKPESYKQYFKAYLSATHFAAPRSTKNPYSDEYNSGLFIAYTPAGYIGHTGGDPGVASMLYFDPKLGKGCFIMVNTGINNRAGMKAFYGIYDAMVKYAAKLP